MFVVKNLKFSTFRGISMTEGSFTKWQEILASNPAFAALLIQEIVIDHAAWHMKSLDGIDGLKKVILN